MTDNDTDGYDNNAYVIIYPNSYGCDYVTMTCDGKSTETYAYNFTSHQYECTYGGLSRCCPVYKGIKTTCQPGQDCSVNCDNGCSSTFIDGTDSTFLTIDCDSYNCQNTLIHCPINGCNIKCHDQYACFSSQIVYNGIISDFGNVNINCTDYYSCDSLIINAEYANEINIDCNVAQYSGNYVCYRTTLNAQYANKINLNFDETYGSYQSNWYVNYAKDITIKAFGNYAIYSSNIYAQNADSLTVICSSDSNGRACYNNQWHVPYDTTFNCFGDGCYESNQIYSYSNLNSMDGFNMNVYSCGECSSFSDCIYSLGLYCNDGNNGDWFYGIDSYNSEGCNSDICGCNNVITESTFSFSVSNDHCYTPLIAKTCTGGIDCIINCDYNNACINSVIDGSDATFLTVNCMYSDYCQNAMIQCPINGCNIICNSSSVCSNAHIIYTGTALTQILNQNGNISVSCTEYYGCSNMIIDANYANAIHLDCTAQSSNQYEICSSMTLNGNYVKYAKLNFYNAYGSYSSTYNLNNAMNIILNAFGPTSFYSSYIYANDANYLELNCGSRGNALACSNSNYYIPYNTNINCFGDGCYQIGTIYSSTNTSELNIITNGCDECNSLSDCIYSFAIYCYPHGPNNGQSSSTCYGYSNTYSYYDYCKCYDVINRTTFLESKHESECYINTISIDDECNGDGDCDIDCDYNGKCNDGFIDGTNYDYLNIKCKGEYYCQNLRILCPVNGCNIQCKYDYSCYYTEIIYPESSLPSIIDSKVNIECKGTDACYYMQIITDNVHSLSLKCTGTLNGWNYVCNYLSINATNSINVDITGNYQYGLANSNIFVNNATTVNINAKGSYGFYTNILYAMNANKLLIKCVSDEWTTAACSTNTWYLSNDTTFNCYGPGCDSLGSLYVSKTAANINFNINSCDDCSDKADCLGSLTIYCQPSLGYYQLTEYYYGYTYTTNSECYDSNEIIYNSEYDSNSISSCGCNELINGISYEENGSDDNCFSPSLSAAEIAKIIGYSVAGLVVVIVICVCLCCYQKRAQRKAIARYTPSNNNNNNTYVPQTISGPVIVKPTPQTVSGPYNVMKPTPQPIYQTVKVIPTKFTPVKSVSTTNDNIYISPGGSNVNHVQLTKVIQSDAPSAPGMDNEPTALMPGASAPPNYDDVPPPNYDEPAPPAYSDVVTPNHIPGEGDYVTNM